VNHELRRSGIGVIGDVPWGLHFSLFYETEADLLEAVVPYFAAGLEAGELCIWAPTAPSIERDAIAALREIVPDLDRHLADRSLEFFSYEDFFKPDGRLDIELAVAQWDRWEERARDDGFAGLRASGNLSWVERDDWETCHRYERTLDQRVVGRRMMVLCSYPLATAGAGDILESAREHSFVIARRKGEWEVLEVPTLARSKEHLQRRNEELEQRVQERNARLSATNDDLRREIEERRRTEAALKRSEAYLQLTQRLSHTGSFVSCFGESNATFWSEETYRIFGLAPRAQPPGREELLEMIHPADRARLEKMAEQTERAQQSADAEFRIVRPDGVVRYVHAVWTPLTDEAERLAEFVGSIVDVTDQKRAAARLARVKRAARERTLRVRFDAVLEERARLARNIHDTLLQSATGIALQVRATLPNLGGAPPATVNAIRRIVELAESAVRDARRAIWDMRDPGLATKGLAAALEEEVRRRGYDVDVRFEQRGVPRRLALDVEDTMFRVAQEAVTNASRHSGTRRVSVILTYEVGEVRLTVQDEGRGFHVDELGGSHGGHWGLLGMRERAERIGARLSIRSAEGAGTTVELRVPTARTASEKLAARREASMASGPRSTRR
jgi:PAS domain S-box-containing protein